MTNFRIEKEGPLTRLFFDVDRDPQRKVPGYSPEDVGGHVLVFDDDELDELRRVLGVGMGDCDHCPELKLAKLDSLAGFISHDMKRLEAATLHLVTRVTKLEDAVNTAPLYDLCKRVTTMENQGIVTGKNNLAKRVATLELQLENHKKIDHDSEHTFIFKKLDLYDEKLQNVERVRDLDGKWIAEQGTRMNVVEETLKMAIANSGALHRILDAKIANLESEQDIHTLAIRAVNQRTQ
jgi:hypothetical protein